LTFALVTSYLLWQTQLLFGENMGLFILAALIWLLVSQIKAPKFGKKNEKLSIFTIRKVWYRTSEVKIENVIADRSGITITKLR